MESHASCRYSRNSGCQVQTGVLKKSAITFQNVSNSRGREIYDAQRLLKISGNAKVSTKDSLRFSCAGKKCEESFDASSILYKLLT